MYRGWSAAPASWRGGGWRARPSASSTIRLDVRELAERVDNSIEFFERDVRRARCRITATTMGVPGYKALVDQNVYESAATSTAS